MPVFTGTLPPSKETIKGNIKTITEYKIDDDGKKVKVNLKFSRCLCTDLPISSDLTLSFCHLIVMNLFCVFLDCAYLQD